MSVRLTRCLTVLFLAGAIALSLSTPGWSYVEVKAGLFMPNGDEKGLKGYENGFGGEVAMGGEIGPIAIDGGAGYYTTKFEQGDLALWIVPITVTAKYFIRPTPALSIYVGGGLGYDFGALRGKSVDELEIKDKVCQGFEFHAVAGLEVPIGPISLIGEIKWSKADVKFGESDEKVNIGGLTALAGLAF